MQCLYSGIYCTIIIIIIIITIHTPHTHCGHDCPLSVSHNGRRRTRVRFVYPVQTIYEVIYIYIYEAGGARKNKTIEPIQSNINLEVQCLREKENVYNDIRKNICVDTLAMVTYHRHVRHYELCRNRALLLLLFSL